MNLKKKKKCGWETGRITFAVEWLQGYAMALLLYSLYNNVLMLWNWKKKQIQKQKVSSISKTDIEFFLNLLTSIFFMVFL